jgi:septal ring factor EnvC (AmiA/AmiB activator)
VWRLPALGAALLLAAAAPTPQQVQEAEQARQAELAAEQAAEQRAQAAAEEERVLGLQRAETAAKLRAAEDALAAAALRVADLSQRQAQVRAQLDATAARLGPLLPIIMRLSLYPGETFLAAPMPPEDAVRGAIVLNTLTRALADQAARLRAEQAEAAALQSELDAALPALRKAQEDQAALAASLDSQIDSAREARLEAQDVAAQAARRAAADAAQADSLRAAIARIEADQRAAEARAREAASAEERRRQEAASVAARARQEALARPAGPGLGGGEGSLTVPVAGRLLRGFGDPTEAGPASGQTWLPAPGARVLSPCGGRVVFAAPFRSYGLLAIVDCGGGYHVVLSGLAQLQVQAGQSIQPGEPVGVMPGWDPRNPSASRPTLYVELRHDGEPVNPAPFLRARS